MPRKTFIVILSTYSSPFAFLSAVHQTSPPRPVSWCRLITLYLNTPPYHRWRIELPFNAISSSSSPRTMMPPNQVFPQYRQFTMSSEPTAPMSFNVYLTVFRNTPNLPLAPRTTSSPYAAVSLRFIVPPAHVLFMLLPNLSFNAANSHPAYLSTGISPCTSILPSHRVP